MSEENNTGSTRLYRASLQDFGNKMLALKHNIASHMGMEVLWWRIDRVVSPPMLVMIVDYNPYWVLVRYKTYDPDGIFRQYLYTTILTASLYCGGDRFEFFDYDI